MLCISESGMMENSMLEVTDNNKIQAVGAGEPGVEEGREEKEVLE